MSEEGEAVGAVRPISDASCAALGIGSEESLRVLARTGRSILLERGECDGAAVPWDRDLVLSCDVSVFALADLLSLIHSDGKSGYLLFQFENEEKAIYLSRGEVVFAESSLSTDRLGACLLRAGLLDQGQLELAESRYHPMTRFGKVVVELGMLTPRELWNGVKSQVEEIVRSLFSFTRGWIHFWEGEVEPDNVVRLSLPTERLIAEGLERRDELLREMARLEDGSARICRGPEPRRPASDNERAVLAAIGEARDFGQICQRAGLDPRTAARTLAFLQLTGHVRIEMGEPPRSQTQDSAEDEVVREAVALHAKLIFELTAPIVALEGAEAVAERLNAVLEETAMRGRALLDSIRFNGAAALDPAELERAALRLAGDRVRELEESLGEIVDYLEFELKNHPGIADSAPFLEAVEPLRAMLRR